MFQHNGKHSNQEIPLDMALLNSVLDMASINVITIAKFSKQTKKMF